MHNTAGPDMFTWCLCTQDTAQQVVLLDAAVSRLRHCKEFTRGDTSPLVSLGDALVAKAEILAKAVLSPGVLVVLQYIAH